MRCLNILMVLSGTIRSKRHKVLLSRLLLRMLLLNRGNRRITLTGEGMIPRKRAEEVMDLTRKTEQEISVTDNQRILNAHAPGCHRGLHLRFLKSQEGYILTIPGQVFPFHRTVSRHHVLRMPESVLGIKITILPCQ